MLVLTQEGEELKYQYEKELSHSGCFCHISPPCSVCMHPGNPLSLENYSEMWEEEKPEVDFSAITREFCK